MKKLVFLSSLLVASAISLSAADGKQLYQKNCAKCHGSEGKGDTKMGQKLGVKDLTDARRQTGMKDETIFKAIKEGVKQGGKTVMRGSGTLSDAEIRSLVAHVRKLKK